MIFWAILSLSLIVYGLVIYKNSNNQFIRQENLEIVAKVEAMTNSLKVKRSLDFLWNEANVGQTISRNTVLFADQNSQAVISYKDGSKLILLPGSIIEIVSEKKDGKFEFIVEKGRVLSVPNPKSPKVESVAVTEDGAVSNQAFLYLVGTKTKETLTASGSEVFNVRWDWTTAPGKDDQIKLEYFDPSGNKHSVSNLGKTKSASLSLDEAGSYTWFLYLNEEAMAGGEVVLNKISPPLLRIPEGVIPAAGEMIQFEWYANFEADKFELELSPSATGQSIFINGDRRSFSASLPKGQTYKWRMRTFKNNIAGAWSEKLTFYLVEEKPLYLEIQRDLISRVQGLYQVEDLPANLDLGISLSEDFSVSVDAQEVKNPRRVEVLKPGKHDVELKHIPSKNTVMKTIDVELLPISEVIKIPKNQEIKILKN